MPLRVHRAFHRQSPISLSGLDSASYRTSSATFHKSYYGLVAASGLHEDVQADRPVPTHSRSTRMRSNEGIASAVSDVWYLVKESHEVTDQFISGPAGASSRLGADPAGDFAADRKAVMVIYGHDKQANGALFDWLRAVGLRPQEWTQLIGASGSASPYVGQVLDTALRNVQAVVAFFTPDEYVTASSALPDDQGGRLQPRPNVLIEAGMALITHPTRTVFVVLGNLDLPSDLVGRDFVRLSHADSAPLYDLANRLRDAGCETNLSGIGWLDPARFPDRDHVSGHSRRGTSARARRMSRMAMAALITATAVSVPALISADAATKTFGLSHARGSGGSSSAGSGNTLQVASADQSLADMTAVDPGNFQRGRQSVNSRVYRKTLSDSFVAQLCGANPPASPDYAIYKLHYRYRYFHAIVGLSDDSPYGDTVQFSIQVDGRQKGMKPALSAGQAEAFNVNITGAHQITLQDVCTRGPNINGDVTAVWINPVLIP